MNIGVFERLFNENLISEQSLTRIKVAEKAKLFSIHWELRAILYLGVLLLTGGLGILIYKNIDTIGHQVILGFILLLSAGCFYYCEKTKLPFSWSKVASPNAYFDYVLLLGCLTMLTFIGYLQAQYNTFGDRYGLATFIPMVVLFFCAYYFDHLGILSLAITNLGAWIGFAVTPLEIFKSNNFTDAELIFAGLALGVFLTLMAHLSAVKKIKPHFCFTYLNFGMNILFVSCLAGMFYFDSFYLLWLIPLGALVFYFYRKAIAMRSFYFILMLTVYGYIGVSYALVNSLSFAVFEIVYLVMMYFIASAVFGIIFLIRMNKKLKTR
ncbi:MAG: DUF2157 domain-containing protein [Chitinophagaceae bacterium]|nr:DUF2157 domain-containing protein [Chitinophagaceae bacterium]